MSYDVYLAEKTEDYLKECKPEKVTKNGYYNCHECTDDNCPFWSDFN